MALETRILNLASAEDFVARTRNVRWEGWDIVTFVPQPRAYLMPHGSWDRRTSRWGIEYRVSPNDNGLYEVKTHGRSRK